MAAKRKMAFSNLNCHSQFHVLSSGVHRAPATLQQYVVLMDIVLWPCFSNLFSGAIFKGSCREAMWAGMYQCCLSQVCTKGLAEHVIYYVGLLVRRGLLQIEGLSLSPKFSYWPSYDCLGIIAVLCLTSLMPWRRHLIGDDVQRFYSISAMLSFIKDNVCLNVPHTISYSQLCKLFSSRLHFLWPWL